MAINKTAYQILNEQRVIHLVKELSLFPQEATVTCREIGDGNLNLVFHLVDQSTYKSVIVKQALPYAKVVGESWPLTIDRARIEFESLKLSATFVPDLVPKVYYTDSELAITIMEDLSDHIILRKGLIHGKQYPNLGKHIGTFMANQLFLTSDFALEPGYKKLQAVKFTNPELCKITEDLIFTDPFHNAETNNFPVELKLEVEKIWNDFLLKLEVAKLKHKFLTQSEALLHGDLHSGSIFVTEQSTKVIDPEFAYYGPIAFDVGNFFGNLILNYISQEAHISNTEKREQFRNYLSETLKETWSVFATTFQQLWIEKGLEPYTKIDGYCGYFLTQVFEDALGFAGCEIIRRTIGLAHVEDLDSVQPFELQLDLKRKALELGRKLVVTRNSIHNIEDILKLVRENESA